MQMMSGKCQFDHNGRAIDFIMINNIGKSSHPDDFPMARFVLTIKRLKSVIGNTSLLPKAYLISPTNSLVFPKTDS